MKKKVFRERYYEKHIGDFKVLDKVEDTKAEVVKPKKTRKTKGDK